MKLSEHLSLSEVIRSESAKRNGISNMPTEQHIANLKLLADKVFEPIRAHFRCPIYISSAYRSIELNRAVKGSLTSQHCSGEAIDVDMDGTPNGVTNKMVFDFIKNNLEFDQLIWEFGTNENPDWVHVSYESTGKQRKQVLKAIRSNGSTQYKQI
jgi:hypothetical protein